MIRYRQVITLALIALCWCALRPALSAARAAQPSAKPTAQTQETLRLNDKLAEQSERLSRVEGRLDSTKDATELAAAAGANAAKGAEQAIETVKWCTTVVSSIITLIAVILGFLGFRELKGIQAAREQVNAAVQKARDAALQVQQCGDDAAKSSESARQTLNEMRGLRDQVLENARVVAEIRRVTESGASVEMDKPVSAEQRQLFQRADTLSEVLESLGQELTPKAYLVRGNAHAVRDDYEGAIAEYDQALRLDPGLVQAHHNRGIALFRLSRHQEALAAFERAIELKPDLARAHLNRGTLLAELGRHQEGLTALGRAIELELNYELAYYNRACVYSRLHMNVDAIRDLNRAIQLNAPRRGELWTDPNFANLRDDPDFRKLVGLEGGSN